MSKITPDLSLEFTFLPPSENKIRIIRVIRGKVGGLAYTKEAIDFKKSFREAIREKYFSEIQAFTKTHTPYSTYEILITLWFEPDQLINKTWPKSKTFYKKVDVGNRRKLLEDCLSECLGIDDSATFDLRMVKQTTCDGNSGIDIDIVQHKDGSKYGIRRPDK